MQFEAPPEPPSQPLMYMRSPLRAISIEHVLQAKQPSYEARQGTVVEFLDEFEQQTMRKFPHHRFTITRQKAMAAQFERHRGPGWIQCDVDFAMDGTIPPPIRGILYRAQEQRAEPPDQLWEVPAGNESLILRTCCR